jgi:hypothetical protein
MRLRSRRSCSSNWTDKDLDNPHHPSSGALFRSGAPLTDQAW